MNFTSERTLDGDTLERDFTLDGIPGVLWTPASATSSPVPLILLGHPGGLPAMRPRLEARAQRSAALGFATAAIELPGSGERPPIAAVDEARLELRMAIRCGRDAERRDRRPADPASGRAGRPRVAGIDRRRAGPARDRWPRGDLGRGHIHRCAVGGHRAADRGCWPVRGQLRATDHHRGRPPGDHPAARASAVGRPRQRPADGPRPLRRLRIEGEDPPGEHGRTHGHPVLRGRRRRPLLRTPPWPDGRAGVPRSDGPPR